MNSRFDINTLLGFLLIGGILLYFGYINGPEEVPDGQKQEQSPVGDTSAAPSGEQSDAPAESSGFSTDEAASGAPSNTASEGRDGRLADTLDQAATKTFVLENELLYLKISSRGGQIVKARLKNYQTYDSLPLHLIDSSASLNLKLPGQESLFTADVNFRVEQVDDRRLRLERSIPGGGTLEYEYFLPEDSYQLQWNLSTRNATLSSMESPRLTWELRASRHEKNLDMELQQTGIYYRFHEDDDVDDLTGSGKEEEQLEDPIRWVSFKQQFFASILQSQRGAFTDVDLLLTPAADEGSTRYMAAHMALPAQGNQLDLPMSLYLGPNKYERLIAYEQEYEQLIPLGWGIFGWINRGVVINVFNWLTQYGLNYGLIILIIALLFKMVLFPLTYQSYRSMAKMRVLKPEIDDLNEKYQDKEPMQKQQAQMELYRKAGVNPLGGCLPMLLQLPILIALFRFFPASIELRQESFLWASDLSTYDSIYDLPFEIPFYGDHVSLFTLLMTVSTLVYTYMNQQLTGSAQNQQLPQMKYIIYFMPVIFLGVFNNYAAGLSYYYFVANVITFGQQFAIRAFLDDDKIRERIQEKKKKPKKENRFMRRMRELQEEQNRQTRRRK